MIYGSVCSGIEAASVAWEPLGWRASFVSEIEPFPRAVLAARYPHIPLHGDFTTIEAGQYDAIDLLVGGTPCQSFSVAGLRGGLADDRGNLALEYLRLADRLRPKWLVWENVPGVLSSNGGRDFGAILGGMVELGYGIAYRVLDAQFFGVPQRRRRVFVVGHLGDWRRAAAVLFERHSLQGHPPPRRETGEGVAPTISARHTGGGGLGTDFDCDGGLIAGTVSTKWSKGTGGPAGDECQNLAAHSLPAEGFDASEDGTGRGVPLIAFDCKASGRNGFGVGDTSPTLRSMGRADSHQSAGGHVAVAFAIQERAVSEDGTGRGTPLVPVGIIKGAAIGREPHNGPQHGEVLTDGTCYTLQTNERHAIAFSSKDHGADAGDISPTLRAGAHSKSHANAGVPPAVVLAQSVEPMYGISHADAAKTYPDQVLRALRDAVGTEAYSEWCLGIIAAFRAPEILQSAMHGRRFRRSSDNWNGMGNDALPQPEDGSAGSVFTLWEAGCDGRAPRGWKPSERLAQELVAHLSELPRQRTSAARFLLGLWRASEGLWLVQQALSALQTAWRPSCDETEPAHVRSLVRRLTPREAERLQGFPDDWTLVTYRNKPAADGPRYKALGNSMAVPVMRWIGERIAAVDHISSLREAA